MLFTERSIIRNIKRDNIINEQDRYSTLDKKFKKKSEGTFKFFRYSFFRSKEIFRIKFVFLLRI